jgi:cytoskeletal protein CcmA (bactofilin family)
VIGPSILINGKLTGDEDLTVRGRVEGELSLSKTLIVEPTGIVKANVAVRNAVVSGVVVGNITATESVELTQEGRMVGDIRSPRVIIVDGASFKGHVDMGNAEPRAATDRPTTARPVVRAQVRPPVAPPRPPTKPMAPVSKPLPPPPPAAKGEKTAPPPPPAVATVAEGGKKKVVLKKKK